MKNNIIWKKTADLTQIKTIATAIAAELKKQASFCLWLKGDLGAGKTTIARELFYHLGLAKHIKVTSPTFTLMAEYKIKDQWYAHLDLYRLDDEKLENLNLEDVFAPRNYAGYLVEWPNSKVAFSELQASHILEINNLTDANTRSYLLSTAK